MSRKLAAPSLILTALLAMLANQTVLAKAELSTTTSTLTIAGKSMSVYKVTSDGTPYYGSGNTAGFVTGWGYTHTPASVSYTFYLPATPVLAGTAASPVYTPLGLSNDLGVALDGVPFDPLTSDCLDVGGSSSNSCTFRVEGRLQTAPGTKNSPYTTGRLGFDVHNGHSQQNPNAYHYHAIPCGIGWPATSSATTATTKVTCNPMANNATTAWGGLPSTATVIGYARDGYPIVVKSGVYASYSVVTSASSGRPTTNSVSSANAYGNWSADMNTLVSSGSTTFTQAKLPSTKILADFMYTGPSTLGTSTSKLGLCNEAPNASTSIKTLDGKTAAYVYYLTPNFPMVPRCLIGVTDGPTTSTQGFYHVNGTD